MTLDQILGTGNRRGIIFFLLAIILFVVNEALCKLVYDTVPANQIMAVRGLIATAVILGIAHARGVTRQIGMMVDRRVLLRATTDLAGSYLYMIALFHMPIGNMMAINMASPLMMTAVVAVVLREPVGWRRWGAIVAGFLGVLLVVQPRAENFNAYSILAVGAVICIVVRDLVTRRIDAAIPSLIVILTNVGMMAVVALGLALVEGWVAMGWRESIFLTLSALFIAAGYQLAVEAFRHAEVPVIVPLRYTGLLWALLLGWLVWGDVPNDLATAGIVLIVASGLYVFHRERVRGRLTPPKI
ncbi:MAG: DMT family transporter [Ferrovibrio sp.]|uniref:DMT family transporter n=1 Tax=Ferrovibrio sp. TaxID=1917215 RepID=UPI00391A92C7